MIFSCFFVKVFLSACVIKYANVIDFNLEMW